MKVLFANKYFFLKGGAEQVMFDEARLLRERGHEAGFFSMVHERNEASDFSKFFVDNIDYTRKDLAHTLKASTRILYSWEAKQKIGRLLDEFHPDVAHLHNIYHQLSPSIIHSLKRAGVPVVMTLHDYKGVCASYSMLAGGKVCEACRGGRYYHCFLKKCVKNSRLKSLLSTLEMTVHHSFMHIYDLVDAFISPSLFLKEKMLEMGFKGEIHHVPNIVDTSVFVPEYDGHEKSITYVGRLSHEKGVGFLVDAAYGLDVTVKIIGEGPLKQSLQDRVKSQGIKNVQFLGFMSGNDLQNEVKQSLFTVMPSACYENHPLSIIESFAMGKPVVGARIGGIPELIKDGETGYTFTAFSSDDLRDKIRMLANNPVLVAQMGRNARSFVEKELTSQGHFDCLMSVYETARKNLCVRKS